jgi:ureidoglycolate lyase
MDVLNLSPQPLNRENFAEFGDVIEIGGARHFSMNGGSLERYYDLAGIDIDHNSGGRVALSITKVNQVTSLPHTFSMLERHPLGSQAFIPLGRAVMYIVVAPEGESVDAGDLRVFVSDGLQGVNYRPGVWHMPLVVLAAQDRFLIVDRGGDTSNCDFLELEQKLRLQA